MFELIASMLLVVVPDPQAFARCEAASQNFTLHVRNLTEPERVTHRPIDKAGSVLDAVHSLKLQPAELLMMDAWIVRPGADGKPQVLPVDWAAIIQRGRTETNWVINAGDLLFLQTRLPKAGR